MSLNAILKKAFFELQCRKIKETGFATITLDGNWRKGEEAAEVMDCIDRLKECGLEMKDDSMIVFKIKNKMFEYRGDKLVEKVGEWTDISIF